MEALGGKMAEYEEDRRNSEASGSEWNDSEEGLPEATGAGLIGRVGRVSSQVRWEVRAGRMTGWLAVELVLLGVERLGWVT